jgi:hypothetical protein
MNNQEIQLFFPHTEEDDLFELYEDRLFEYKQFFVQRAPVSQVFLAKCKKMMQMHMAYVSLVEKEFSYQKKDSLNFEFTTDVKDAFNAYQAYRNTFKNIILQSTHACELQDVLLDLIQLNAVYFSYWPSVEETDELIVVSKEPDPMSLVLAIREFNALGGYTFKDMLNQMDSLPSALELEMKRVSLLRKKEQNA